MTAKYFKYDEEYNLRPIYNDDLVEVVRCKDCKYVGINYPNGYIFCRMFENDRKADDYCSRGKRRETE